MKIKTGISQITTTVSDFEKITNAINTDSITSAFSQLKSISNSPLSGLTKTLNSASSIEEIANATKGLNSALLVQVLTSKKLTPEQIKQVLLYQQLTDEEIANAFASSGVTKANWLQNFSWKALGASIVTATKALWVFITTTPQGMLLGIGAVIGGVIFSITQFSKTLKKAQEQAQESAETLEQTKNEIESLNAELETTKKRIDELNAKANLSLIEQDELTRLITTNDELERELRIKKEIAAVEGIKAQKDAIESINLKAAYSNHSENVNAFDRYGNKYDINRIDATYERISDAKELEDEISKLQTDLANNVNDKHLEKELKQKEKLLEKYKKEASTYIKDLMIEDDVLAEGTSEDVVKLRDTLDKLYQSYDAFMYNTGQNTTELIKGVVDKKEFSGLEQELISSVKSGQDLEKTFNSIQFQGLKVALEDAKINLTDFYTYIQSLANPNALNIENITSQFQEILVQTAISKGKAFQQAFIQSQNYLKNKSEDEIKIAYEIIKDTDTSSWGFDDFDYAIAKRKKEKIVVQYSIDGLLNQDSEFSKTVATYQTKLKTLQDALTTLQTRDLTSPELFALLQEFPELNGYIDDLDSGINKLMLSARDDALVILNEAIKETTNPEQLKQLEALVAIMNGMTVESLESAEGVKTLSETLSNLASNKKLLSDINKEVKDTKKISAETLNDIISAYPKLETAVSDYLRGKLSEKELIQELSSAYQTDLNNYYTYTTEKQKLDNNFYDDVLDNLPIWVTEASKKYLEDFDNYKEYLESKLKLDQEYAKLKAINEKAQIGSFSDGTVFTNGMNLQTDKAIQDYSQQRIAELDNIINGINTSLKTTLDLDLPTFSDDNKSDKSSSPQVIDWIARKLEILGRNLDIIKKKASEVYSTFKNQNTELEKAKTNLEEQIKIQQDSYEKYMNQAKSVGLSKALINKVQNGSMDITKYSSETADKISQYQEWYDKGQAVLQTITDLKLQEKELIQQEISNIIDDYDRKKSYQEALISKREAEISKKEAKGSNASEKDYNYLLNHQNHIRANLLKEYDEVNSRFELLNKNPKFQYSDKWYELKETLVGLETEITNCDTEIINLTNSIEDVRWKNFEDAIDKIERIKSEISDLQGLLSGDNLDENGKLTNVGLTNLALNFQGIVESKQAIADYQVAIDSLNKSDADYAEKLADLQGKQRQAASDLKGYKDAIIDFKKNAIEAETEAMRKNVEIQKEKLQAEKDLHDYENSIKDKENDIVVLQKKINALSLSTDRKDIALRLSLEQELSDAQKELTEEQYNHSIETQQQGLDDELTAYEESQNDKVNTLENSTEEQQKVINEYLNEVLTNSTTVLSGINDLAKTYGIDLTTELTSPWASGISKAKEYFSLVNGEAKPVTIDTSPIDSTGGYKDTSTTNTDSKNSSTTGTKETTQSKTQSTVGLVSSILETIKYGQRGSNVARLQEALKDLKYDIGSTGIDGKFGDHTLAAVKKFQKDNGLKQDGIVGDLTKKKFKLHGYKTGVNKLLEDELAWTQEDGSEIIIKPSQNAMLTPLNAGDGVINTDITKNLVAWGKMSPDDLFNSNLPNLQATNKSTSIGNISVSLQVTGVTRDEINAETQKKIEQIPKDIMKELHKNGVR